MKVGNGKRRVPKWPKARGFYEPPLRGKKWWMPGVLPEPRSISKVGRPLLRKPRRRGATATLKISKKKGRK